MRAWLTLSGIFTTAASLRRQSGVVVSCAPRGRPTPLVVTCCGIISARTHCSAPARRNQSGCLRSSFRGRGLGLNEPFPVMQFSAGGRTSVDKQKRSEKVGNYPRWKAKPQLAHSPQAFSCSSDLIEKPGSHGNLYMKISPVPVGGRKTYLTLIGTAATCLFELRSLLLWYFAVQVFGWRVLLGRCLLCVLACCP